jgi:hypothetical protein
VPKAPPRIPRGALQRGRQLCTVNADTRLHTDSGGHCTGIARTRQRRAAGSAIACSSTHAPSETAATTTDSAVDYGRRRATTDLTMSIRAWSDSRTREAITWQVAQQIHQSANVATPTALSTPTELSQIGKIPISRTNIGIFPISQTSVIRKRPRVRNLHLSRFLLTGPRQSRRAPVTRRMDDVTIIRSLRRNSPVTFIPRQAKPPARIPITCKVPEDVARLLKQYAEFLEQSRTCRLGNLARGIPPRPGISSVARHDAGGSGTPASHDNGGVNSSE